MASWIYIFSKFTPESLLFESLGIFLLICAYTGLWILRKYKFGIAADEIPSSVVKSGLNQLIGDAEALRAQLFGMMAENAETSAAFAGGAPGTDAGPSVAHPTASSHTLHTAGGNDPEVLKKLAAFETKMLEQAKLLETMQAEKAKLEQDLVKVKASGVGAGASTPDAEKLKDKVASLEARLAEYSVIEDDLANLKRLQQENTQLKTALAKNEGGASAALAAQGAGTDATLGAGESATGAEASAASAPLSPSTPQIPATPENPEVADLTAATSSIPLSEGLPANEKTNLNDPHQSPLAQLDQAFANANAASLEAEFNAATAASATAGATPPQTNDAAQSAATPNFETLVDSVEKSLQPTDSVNDVSKTTKQAPTAPHEKSDEDLISEFERMLNS
jgi:hypothetical protein